MNDSMSLNKHIIFLEQNNNLMTNVAFLDLFNEMFVSTRDIVHCFLSVKHSEYHFLNKYFKILIKKSCLTFFSGLPMLLSEPD